MWICFSLKLNQNSALLYTKASVTDSATRSVWGVTSNPTASMEKLGDTRLAELIAQRFKKAPRTDPRQPKFSIEIVRVSDGECTIKDPFRHLPEGRKQPKTLPGIWKGKDERFRPAALEQEDHLGLLVRQTTPSNCNRWARLSRSCGDVSGVSNPCYKPKKIKQSVSLPFEDVGCGAGGHQVIQRKSLPLLPSDIQILTPHQESDSQVG